MTLPIIGFNFPLTEKQNNFEPDLVAVTKKQSLYSSQKKVLRLKESGSVLHKLPYVISKSLEHSKAWFKREIQVQLDSGNLFEDPFMPPVDSSIRSTGSSRSSQYNWLRPTEIIDRPKFIAEGISRFDVQQGELGDCWLLAAVASLSMHPELFKEVIPDGQSFLPSSNGQAIHHHGFAYVGMFLFRFWRFGNWVDVVVDDRLPTTNRRLIFMHSNDRTEFWSALLEKAYAKLVGGYDLLRGGSTAEAMEDFTGGMTEFVELGEKAPKRLFEMMERAQNRSSLMACSIDASPNQIEADGPMGLILGHAYSVTDVRKVFDENSRIIFMIRLRNPWGNDREWNGPWSDKSHEWKRIDSSQRQSIGLTFENDGEFWMEMCDFVKYFSRLEMCHLSPEFSAIAVATGAKRRWEMTLHHGEWLRNSTAGGCRNFVDTFHMNPQFIVEVEDPDETNNDPTGVIVVGLMQTGMREKRQLPHTIGYSIYDLPSNAPSRGLLTKSFFLTTQSTTRSPVFINMREVCGRHKLVPGRYVIIPSTFKPNEEAKFLLRIFSEKACSASELDERMSIGIAPSVPSIPTSADELHMSKLKSAFELIAGESGDIESNELMDILNKTFKNKGFNFNGFSLETARSMVALMDIDTSGTLGFDEFKKLWYELRLWQTIYKKFDPEEKGVLRSCDLRDVLRKTGIQVTNEMFKAIVCRYVNKGRLVFDDFILLVVRLITVFEKFKSHKILDDGTAQFTVDEFMRAVLYT